MLFRILQGWFYYFFRNKKVEEVAKKRILFCLNCKYLKWYRKRDQWLYQDHGMPMNPNKVYCSKCMGCPISKKIRSPKERCPIKKW
jgi:hypothetical protein